LQDANSVDSTVAGAPCIKIEPAPI